MDPLPPLPDSSPSSPPSPSSSSSSSSSAATPLTAHKTMLKVVAAPAKSKQAAAAVRPGVADADDDDPDADLNDDAVRPLPRNTAKLVGGATRALVKAANDSLQGSNCTMAAVAMKMAPYIGYLVSQCERDMEYEDEYKGDCYMW